MPREEPGRLRRIAREEQTAARGQSVHGIEIRMVSAVLVVACMLGALQLHGGEGARGRAAVTSQLHRKRG